MSGSVIKRTLVRYAAFLFSPLLFGQSLRPTTPAPTFRMSGTITGGQSLAVVFEGASSRTVLTNEAGAASQARFASADRHHDSPFSAVQFVEQKS